MDVYKILLNSKKEFNKILIEKNLNVNSIDDDDETALIIASYFNDYETVKFLLKQPNININAKNKNGDTALSIALKKNYSDIINLFMNTTTFMFSDSMIKSKYEKTFIPPKTQEILTKKLFSTRYNETLDTKIFDDMCKSLLSYSQKFLGSGTFGKVYSLKDEIKNVIENYFGTRNIVVKQIKTENSADCLVEKLTIQYESKNPITLKNVFYCSGDNLIFSEFFISIIASKLNSNNFIDTYTLKACDNGDQLIFMEQIDGTLSELIDKVTIGFKDEDEYNSDIYKELDILYIQILHALWCMHQLKINHGDSSINNIFYINVTNDTLLKNNTRFRDYEFAVYDFGNNRKYYIPTSDIKYIIKIGDFGLSNKFSEPYILNDHITQKYMVDFFTPLYDLMITFYYRGNTSPFYKMIQFYLLEVDFAVDLINKTYDIEKFFSWFEKFESKIDDTCNNCKFIKNIVNTNDREELIKVFTDNYYAFFLSDLVATEKDQDVDRRQNYNFLLSEMYKKRDINIDNLVDKHFFKTRMEQLGYDIQQSNFVCCLLGGPGNDIGLQGDITVNYSK